MHHLQKLDFNKRELLMRVGGGPRVVVHIVEGEGDKQPGRIRTLRLDYNVGTDEWLQCEWKKEGDVRYLRTATISDDHAKNGAFFLPLAYADDPNPQKREQGPALWAEWVKQREAKQDTGPFPTEWLPQKVLDLMKFDKAKQAKTFQAPKLEKPPSAKS